MSSSSEEEYEVEKILEKKGSGSGLKYLIKWKGYQKATWEPAANCDCKEMIIAFEREQGAHDTSEEEETSKTSPRSGSSKKRRVVQSPKRRHPPNKSPSQPRSSRLNLNESSESEYEGDKKKQKVDPSFVQGSSRSSTRLSVNANTGTPRTPKNALGRSRTSLRSQSTVKTPVASSPQQSSSPRKRTRTSAKKSPVKKAASKSPRRNLPQSPRLLTPLSECDDLAFEIERIDSLADTNGRKRLMVKTTDGRTKTVDIKAAAKQNCDLVLDFLIARVP